MFLDRPRVIRDITFRDDIRYALWLQPAQAERDRGEGDDEGDDEKGDSFEDFCVEFIRQRISIATQQETKARAIVYVESKARTETLAE